MALFVFVLLSLLMDSIIIIQFHLCCSVRFHAANNKKISSHKFGKSIASFLFSAGNSTEEDWALFSILSLSFHCCMIQWCSIYRNSQSQCVLDVRVLFRRMRTNNAQTKRRKENIFRANSHTPTGGCSQERYNTSKHVNNRGAAREEAKEHHEEDLNHEWQRSFALHLIIVVGVRWRTDWLLAVLDYGRKHYSVVWEVQSCRRWGQHEQWQRHGEEAASAVAA